MSHWRSAMDLTPFEEKLKNFLKGLDAGKVFVGIVLILMLGFQYATLASINRLAENDRNHQTAIKQLHSLVVSIRESAPGPGPIPEPRKANAQLDGMGL